MNDFIQLGSVDFSETSQLARDSLGLQLLSPKLATTRVAKPQQFVILTRSDRDHLFLGGHSNIIIYS